MRTRLTPFLLVLFASAFLALPAHAIDRSGQTVGVGFQTAPVAPVLTPAMLSLKFAAGPSAEFSVLLGTSARDDLFSLSFGGKAIFVLVPEERLNLYATAALLPSIGTGGFQSLHWFAGPGVAYTPPGADNLELFGEFGLGGVVVDDDLLGFGGFGAAVANGYPVVATTGQLVLGLHYWF